MTAAALPTPAGATDCHVHVIGPSSIYPMGPGRAYTPPDASVAELLAFHESLGIDRVVLIQLSAYGTDNSAMLAGLAELGDRARAIAVIDDSVPDAALASMRDAGVAGLRVNLETFGGSDPVAAAAQLQRTASRAAAVGMHVQIYTNTAIVTALRDTIIGLPVPVVIDHFGASPGLPPEGSAGYDAMIALAGSGQVYVKLSGTYRFADGPWVPGVADFGRELIGVAADRMLWATDWPNTAVRRGSGPHDPFAVVPFQVVDNARALSELKSWAGTAERLQQILVDNPARLYGF